MGAWGHGRAGCGNPGLGIGQCPGVLGSYPLQVHRANGSEMNTAVMAVASYSVCTQLYFFIFIQFMSLTIHPSLKDQDSCCPAADRPTYDIFMLTETPGEPPSAVMSAKVETTSTSVAVKPP